MSNLGQKIKEAFTGHHDQDKSDVKTPDVNAPGAFPSDEPSTKHHSDHNKLTKEPPHAGHTHQDKSEDVERGALHHTGHSHHDPEPETKQATSEAGNYPYWGNLPREGGEHVHRSEGPDSGATKQQHGLGKDSGLATGALATGASTAGAGYLGSEGSKYQDTNRADEITRADATEDSKYDHSKRDAGVAGAAGLAGATHLATRDKDDADKTEKKPTHEVSKTPAHSDTSKTTQHTKTSTTTQKPVETATPTKTTSAGDNESHRKEEALAAGAGAAGLAGAGYYASQKEDKPHEATRDTGSHGTQGSTIQSPSQTATSRHDPVTEAQKATSAAGNYPYWSNDDNANRATQSTGIAEAAAPSKTTSSGDNESHRKEQALAAGAGASGLTGGGLLASNRKEERKDEVPSSTRETTSGIAAPGSRAQRDTTSRQDDPTTSGGIHNTVVGAGSSEYSPPVGSSTTTGAGYQTQASSQPSQPVAQAAAQQAWNKQQPASSNTVGDTGKDNRHSDLGYAAAGTAFGAGATGLAANYGQGKEHETNPRTDTSEKVADRALGSDGKPHAPSSTEGFSGGNDKTASSGLTSGVAGLAGQSGSSGTGSKVLHKCDNCGHDNDISRYFNKDAIFRSQQ
ncbi:hypothetical protein INS49_006360 [Diaporthe citri]|uniref:uncharacterized protein n=1 Tax=Diaporthe citri TaxID=83186 RepID=UPI001C823356|nr:uncharacterized protein INS49_006360 [Diaporthe citri]KAG6364756.1 hypothetical protein INS49_006360 [Diaporthe citri]